MSIKKNSLKQSRYDREDCKGIDPDDVIERETMRLKRLKIEQDKISFFTKISNSMRSFSKRINDFLDSNKEIVKSMGAVSSNEIKSVISDLSSLIDRVERLMLKAKIDADLFSEPVADIACAGNRATRRK